MGQYMYSLADNAYATVNCNLIIFLRSPHYACPEVIRVSLICVVGILQAWLAYSMFTG